MGIIESTGAECCTKLPGLSFYSFPASPIDRKQMIFHGRDSSLGGVRVVKRKFSAGLLSRMTCHLEASSSNHSIKICFHCQGAPLPLSTLICVVTRTFPYNFVTSRIPNLTVCWLALVFQPLSQADIKEWLSSGVEIDRTSIAERDYCRAPNHGESGSQAR